MSSRSEKLIAVIGATGHQGGSVARALKAVGRFRVRALTRNPDKHRDLADEVVQADLERPSIDSGRLNREIHSGHMLKIAGGTELS